MCKGAENDCQALSASGTYTAIDAPGPGQGLRLKKLEQAHPVQHHFRPDNTQELSLIGPYRSLVRGIVALSTIVAVGIWLGGSILMTLVLILGYIFGFHAWMSRTSNQENGQPRVSQKVCVIGGGLSGLVTLKELTSAGHRAKCFEGGEAIGGGFRQAYDSCHLTVSNHWIAFSDFPPREQERLFWSAEQYLGYLSDYAQHFGLCSLVELKTFVTDVTRHKSPTAPMGFEYSVSVRDGTTGEERTERFDAVVVCTGNNRKAKVPDWEGAQEFIAGGGKLLHTSDYSQPEPFRAKRVVCVGMGESGSDIVSEIAEVSESCLLSLRRGVSVSTKYPMRSGHTNDAFHARMHYYAHPTLNNRLFTWLNKKIVNLQGIDPAFHLIGRCNLEAGGGSFQFITKNENFIEPLVTGKCVKVPGVARLTSTGVHLTDGTSHECDIVMCNTGM